MPRMAIHTFGLLPHGFAPYICHKTQQTMRARLLVIGLMLLATSLFSQGFRKRLTLEEGIISNIWLCNAPGGGLYAASFQNNTAAKYSLFLTKLSATGDIEWTRKSNANRLGIGVTSDPDGNVYLVYETIANNAISGVVVEKVSPVGQTLWQKKDDNNAFSLSYHALSYHNGRLFVSNNSQQQRRITAFNSNSGSVAWTRLYDCTVASVNDNIYQLLALNDGTFLATTQVAHYINTSFIRSLLHLDASGNFIKIKSYNGFAFIDLEELSTGSIAFTAKSDDQTVGGATTAQYFVGVMGPDLEFKWVKKLRSAAKSEVLGLEGVDNGNFIVCVQNPGENCLGESIVFRADESGNVQWSKALKDGAFFSIQHVNMPDNGLAWVSYNPAIDTAVIINRVANDGTIAACPTTDSQPFTLVDTTITSTIVGWVSVDGNPWITTPATVFGNIDAKIEDYCPNLALDATFTLSDDTVCQQTVVQAFPANNLGNTVWQFGLNGIIRTQISPAVAEAAMTLPGLIPVTQIRSLGLCSDTVVHEVYVRPGPPAELGPKRILCPGDTVTLQPPPFLDVSYQWSNGSTAAALKVSTPGTYTVLVSGSICSSRDTVLVTMATAPTVSLGPDQLLCQGDSYTFSPTVNPEGGDFVWSDGSTGPRLTVTDTGVYYLTVQVGACEGSDTVRVDYELCPSLQLYVPNVFAPDGSAENNQFRISTLSADLRRLSVYDRWGSLVFLAEGAPFEWDGLVKGQKAPSGVYVYVLEYQDLLSGDNLLKTGQVTVIR